ncbi:WD40/YVTN/BNR-like repeat-containing protein [Peristeroidobacter soli]|uniref:WD40/YVTN/BNR-like repeat-containing protein n=1 Tax=Peristeroidobacter soli TaxID=2497877 RepID=UPI00101C5E28|nr:hypothetical protein [Peristeroidobacter soli]
MPDHRCLPRVLLVFVLTSAVVACRLDKDNDDARLGGSRSSGTASGGPALLSITAEAPGQNCVNGGSRIDRGVDTNRNDVLDTTEITGTQYVCSGGGAVSLVEMHDEPAGSHCPTGGKQFTAGLDGNGDGVLDVSEIRTSGYICNGEPGGTGVAALTAVAAEPAGANCPGGGVRMSSGADINQSGALDPAEVTNTQYVCGGASGASTLIRTDNETPGLNCAYGGTRIGAGLDVNGNALLEPSEVTVNAYACNGAPGAGLTWQDISGAAVQAVPNRGYLATSGTAELVVTLPSAPAPGDLLQITGVGAGGWRIAQNTGQFIVTRHLAGEIAAAWTEREADRSWQAVASSADGQRLLAADYGGQLYTSIDGGMNWVAREANRYWRAVASSADGQRLAAGESGGQIYISSDAGVTWATYESARDWCSIASSADGTHLVAAASGDRIYTSSDSGLNWVARAASRAWVSVASSSDGQRLVAAVSQGQIYTSGNGGVSWTARDSNREWTAVAASADGQRLLASEFLGQLHTSTDAGATWSARDATRGWFAVASSADGQRLLAAEIGGYLYASSDAGQSWRERELQRNWAAVASSADGMKLLGAVVTGRIHTSVPLQRERSTVGTVGSVSGRQYDAITLQYAGAGEFIVLNFVGALAVE